MGKKVHKRKSTQNHDKNSWLPAAVQRPHVSVWLYGSTDWECRHISMITFNLLIMDMKK